MRKIFTGILLVQLSFCLNLKAQSTDVLRNELNTIFQYVDKAQIPTGYLEEYGPGFLPLAPFNGVLTDSNRFDFDSWQILYGQIRASKIYGTTSLPDLPATINTVNNTGNHSNHLYAVPLLLMDYSILKPNAAQQNLVRVRNNQIFDVAGRTQSPWQQKTFFGASPAINGTDDGVVSLLFKPELLFTNTNKTIGTVQVDFNDGSGYTTVALNNPYTKTYTDTGYKRLKIKLTCNDGSTYQCYTEFYVTGVAANNNNIADRYGNRPDIINRVFNPVAGPGPLAHSGGKVTVWFSKKGTERTLNKPFIIIEGYDASRVAPAIKDSIDYKALLNIISTQPGAYDFVGNLDDVAGYDLVFIDFNNGTDHILRNAAFFKEVLAWVNQTKAANPNPQENVILGMSMGGLIIRYALAEMTKNNIPHSTRLIISHDSPHRGANAPLSIQYLTRYLASRGSIGGFLLNQLPLVSQGNTLLNEPATSQLAIYHSTSHNTYQENTFLATTYRNMVTFSPTGPQPTYRFIATASGSECGVPLLAPGADLINVNAFGMMSTPWLLNYYTGRVKFDLQLKALPANGVPANIVNFGITVDINMLWGLVKKSFSIGGFNASSPPGALPWDGAPGGTQSISERLKVRPFNYILPLSGVSYQTSELFSHVATVSALDITNITPETLTGKYVGGISPGNPSRAANFIAQESFTQSGNTAYNNGHRFYTARNAQWLFNEMEGIVPNAINCSNACTPSFNILGNEFLCSSATYLFDQLPANGSITWSVSNLSLATISSSANANPVTLSANGSGGYVTLTASTVFCGQPVTKTKQVFVGVPDMPYVSPYNYDLQCGTFAEAYATTPLGTTGHFWNLNFGLGVQDKDGYGSNYFYTAPFVNGAQPGLTYYNYLTVQAKNACGLSIPSQTINLTVGPVPYNCGGGGGPIMLRVVMSPVPAGNQLNIAVNTQEMQQNDNNNPAWMQIREVKIYDKFGVVRKRKRYGAGTQHVNIPVQDLPNDVYNVHVTNGTHNTIRTILIQR